MRGKKRRTRRTDALPTAPPARLALRLEVVDPEVIVELMRHAEVEERERFALAALRLGILSLRHANGQLDGGAIQEAGRRLMADMRELLSTRAVEMTREIAAHLGEGSPVLRMLSPTEANGLLSQVTKKLEAALTQQRDRIVRDFSLDIDDSALSRLKRELQTMLDGLVTGNTAFYIEVRETLASLRARKEEAARSTRHGVAFEVQLGDLLASEAQRMGDIHQATGNRTGSIKNCKIGDHVVECGPESPAPGVKIAWEAKEHKRYALKNALKEIEKARKNRSAQVGVFVFSKKTAPAKLQPLARYGSDIVIVWDAEDPATDIYVKAAFSIGRALAVREARGSQEAEGALHGIEAAARAVEKQIGHLAEFKKMGDTVAAHGTKIADRAARMKEGLTKEVERLDEQIAALKTARS